jgi:protein-disulfide isomerase
MHEGAKNKLLVALGLMGLIIAALTALAEHVPWLQAFCTGFSDGCRETAKFTLLRVPLWGWGIAFYAMLALCAIGRRNWISWLIPSAVGVEIALIWIMISADVICVFCLGNLLIVALLIFFSLDKSRFWQTTSLTLLFFLLAFLIIPHENELQGSSHAVPPVPVVVEEEKPAYAAKVGDKYITDEELRLAAGAQLMDLELEIYRLKRQKLDQMVVELLLQAEAVQRGMTLDQFVNSEIVSKGAPVTDADIDQYLNENKSRLSEWKGTREELRARVQSFLQSQRTFENVVKYARTLEPKYGVEVYLPEPESITANVGTEGSPSIGPKDAPVTVFEFSDYQCPACRQGHDTVRKIREIYSGQIRWIFKNYPLKMHKDAERAAQAALCAADQNRFWDYQDVLYATTEDLTVGKLEQLAVNIGLTLDPFKQCLESGKYKSKVEQDIQDARNAGVNSTPTFIINDRRKTGAPPLEQFKAIIDEELKRAKEKM